MQADNTGNAYSLITAKGYGYEVPDCNHDTIHILEKWDEALHKNVFVFNIHALLDDDRCTNFDRQRNEIKTSSASTAPMKGYLGETVFARWKFKLDSAFQPSPNFCHIHQIKAGDGPDQDLPLITITPRYGSNNTDKLQIIFTAPTPAGAGTYYIAQTSLAPFKGAWVEALEQITYGSPGKYKLELKRVSDDMSLLSYSSDTLAMWRDTSTFMRPKYGIYRSLNSVSYLRDESVLFADFSLYKTPTAKLPAAPSNLATTSVSGGLIKLSWSDNATNEDQFRIDRSRDGIIWTYIATSNVNTTAYTDTVLLDGAYYYRLRAENCTGNSAFTPSVSASITSINSDGYKKYQGYVLSQNYPNPFNPSTKINFTLPKAGYTKLSVYNVVGEKAVTLINDILPAGNHSAVFEAGSLPSGLYFYKLESGGYAITKKMVILK